MNFNISLTSFSINKSNPTVQNNSENTEAFTPANGQEQLPNSVFKSTENLYFKLTNANANVMNNVQQNIFLRDILGLPKEWTNLLKEFIYSDNAQIASLIKSLSAQNQTVVNDALIQLLNSNSKVNLEALMQFLNKNSTLMNDKFLKYMGADNMSQSNISQLKELMLIGASITTNAQVNPNELIRNVIQMYLPWLPVVPPKDNDLNEIEAQMSKDDNKNAQVLFYISTNNSGYFKVEILMDNGIEIYINHLTQNSDEELIKYLTDKLKSNIITPAPNAKLFYSVTTQTEKIRLEDKQLFIVNSDNTMLGLTLIHVIAKTILEFDDKEAKRFLVLKNQS